MTVGSGNQSAGRTHVDGVEPPPPLIAAIFGQQDFSALHFTINGSQFNYGSFINAVFAFVTIAAAYLFLNV